MSFEKKKSSLPRKFPLTVKNGNIVVKVYRSPNAKSSTGFSYRVRWTVSPNNYEERKSVKLEDALDLAERQAEYLNSAKADADRLRRTEKEAYVLAQDLARDTPVVTAIREWKKAKELTGGNIIPAAKAWNEQYGNTIQPIKVKDVIPLFKKAMILNNINWKASYAKTLPRFERSFGNKFIATLGVSPIQNWVSRPDVKVGTRNSDLKRIKTMFSWCQDYGYLPENVKTAVDRIKRLPEQDRRREVISPRVFRELIHYLKEHHPHYLPPLVLAGFCGMRAVEIHSQLWSDIRLDLKKLVVSSAKAGTAAYREVDICEAAIEWILLSPNNREGKVCFNIAIDQIRRIAKKASLHLPPNCFRNSFISYHVKTGEKSVGLTAQQAGNTEGIIHRHYRALVSEEDAEEWFSIRPGDEDRKVVEFEQA